MNGFIIVNKNRGFTSNDVVVMIRGALKAAGIKEKVGHLGTLDPEATGVLPVSIGKATRLFDFFLKKDKEYIAEFTFGMTTDTLDGAGTVIEKDDKTVTFEEFKKACSNSVGKYMQTPPSYSAKSINGKKAYELARKGKEFELQSKEIEIFSVSEMKEIDKNIFSVKIRCSSGTYIRAVARDLAKALHTLGYMSALKRVRAGEFKLVDAEPLEEILNSEIVNHIKPILPFINLKRFELPESLKFKALNGVKVELENAPHEDFILLSDGELVGIAEYNGGLKIKTRLG